jgi:hypothetical protein
VGPRSKDAYDNALGVRDYFAAGGWGGAAMTDADQRRENMEQARRAQEILHEFSMRIDDSGIKSGDALLRNVLLINGGAAVAILAFMGSVISKDAGSHKIIGDIAGGLTYFASGVIASVAALGLTYLSTSPRGWLRLRRRRSGNIRTSSRESTPLGWLV